MKRGWILFIVLVACGGAAKDATPAVDVKPAPPPSPCDAAVAARASAEKLAAEGHLERVLRTIAQADGLCPSRAADSRALRERIEKDLEVGPAETGDGLVAAAEKALEPAAARRLYAKAAVAFARETGQKPAVAIENGAAGQTQYAEMAWAGDGSLFFIAQGKTLIGLEPQGWRERFATRFAEDIRTLEAVPKTSTLLVSTGWSGGWTYVVDPTRGGARNKLESIADLRPVLSPNGTRALLASSDRMHVRLVSLPDGATLATLGAEPDAEPLKTFGTPMAFTPSGKLFTIEWGDAALAVFDVATAHFVAGAPLASSLDSGTLAWRISDDERWLVMRTPDAKRRTAAWRAIDLEKRSEPSALVSPACKDGTLVALSHASGRAAMWARTNDVARLCVFDVANGRLLGSVDVPDLKRDKRGKLEDPPWTTGVAFTADDAMLVVRTSSHDAGDHIRFARPDGGAWTKDTLKPGLAQSLVESASRYRHVDEPALVALRSKGSLVSPDGKSSVARTETGVLTARGPGGTLVSPRPAEPVLMLHFVEGPSNPTALAVAGNSGSVRRLDLETGRVDVTLDGDNDGYRYPFALDALGQPVTFGERYVVDQTQVRLESEYRLFTPSKPDGVVVSVASARSFGVESRSALDARGGRLVVTTSEGVEVWDVAAARETSSFKLQRPAIAMALSADGTKLAVSTRSSPLQMWDVASGTQLCGVPDDDSKSNGSGALAFLGPRADTVVTRSYNDVSSWRADTCAAKGGWASEWNDTGSPRRMAVSSDGSRIVVIGSRKLWVLDGSLKAIRSFPADTYDDALAVANDGTVALGRENGTIDVFEPGGALRSVLLVPRTRPGAAAAVTPDGRFRALGDEKAARAYLSCRFGIRVVPLDVCGETLEDPTLLGP